eukprot:CAMPEP_0176387028 /NCGR_PEP_ID=MMETSP0126-20121128/36427_1 /TAXON_ID=141414 ORGANISM="Strombidinopsis acuminatum, Strain SPMC142" /NCGR_SAMPLE_ID=MMETSP0126 /ASSEMBLY_ACC=CAM_ASM_000229 /LENGTH=33 /DNA_ID= /DNA_START= /DNA_END= /DNA_ORIENTATION=
MAPLKFFGSANQERKKDAESKDKQEEAQWKPAE